MSINEANKKHEAKSVVSKSLYLNYNKYLETNNDKNHIKLELLIISQKKKRSPSATGDLYPKPSVHCY
jgi:hypothetical protein